MLLVCTEAIGILPMHACRCEMCGGAAASLLWKLTTVADLKRESLSTGASSMMIGS